MNSKKKSISSPTAKGKKETNTNKNSPQAEPEAAAQDEAPPETTTAPEEEKAPTDQKKAAAAPAQAPVVDNRKELMDKLKTIMAVKKTVKDFQAADRLDT